MPTRRISWSDSHRVSMALAGALEGAVEAICPVGRGGLVPAAIVAYALQKPVMGYLPLEPSVALGFQLVTRGLLVIDDIADTGRTFADIRACYPKAIYAAPYVKPQGRGYTDYWIEEIPQDTWLIFPWNEEDR